MQINNNTKINIKTEVFTGKPTRFLGLDALHFEIKSLVSDFLSKLESA